jgi:hypothetical protein
MPRHPLLLLGGPLGRSAPQLLLGLGLGGSLGVADGAGAGHGGLSEICPVARLGGLRSNALVCPVKHKESTSLMPRS